MVRRAKPAGPPRIRRPGLGRCPAPTKATTPLALRANVRHNHVLHEHVVIVSAQAQNVPHIPPAEQVSVDDLGHTHDGIVHLTIRYGFADTPNIPQALQLARSQGAGELGFDPATASYFLSRATLGNTNAPGMARWRKLLFITMAHNAANPADHFGLPTDQTAVMGSHISL